MILLPLRSASLTHKNPVRREVILGMRLVGRKDRSIDPFVFIEISCSCNSCGSYYGCCLTMPISFILLCFETKVLYFNFSIL